MSLVSSGFWWCAFLVYYPSLLDVALMLLVGAIFRLQLMALTADFESEDFEFSTSLFKHLIALYACNNIRLSYLAGYLSPLFQRMEKKSPFGFLLECQY